MSARNKTVIPDDVFQKLTSLENTVLDNIIQAETNPIYIATNAKFTRKELKWMEAGSIQ
jgi:hypothetical protein